MIHRVITLHGVEEIPGQILAQRCLNRTVSTAWRGAVAFVGKGRVWAVGQLATVEAQHSRGALPDDPPDSYLWCFKDIKEVEGVVVADYDGEACFMLNGRLEPQFLQSGSQAVLNCILENLAQTPEPVDEPELEITRSESGQFSFVL